MKIPVIGAGGGAGVVEKATGKGSYLRIPELQFGYDWGGRAEKVVPVFRDIDNLLDLADGKWRAGVDAVAAVKAGDVGAAGIMMVSWSPITAEQPVDVISTKMTYRSRLSPLCRPASGR